MANQRDQPADTQESDSRPPQRPKDKGDLDFSPQKYVRWFRPKVLASTGQRVILSSAIGDFLDKRELQGSIPAELIDHGQQGGEVWVDFVADTGDGFNATYSIAWLTAQRELAVQGLDRTLPRPGLLVFGGDEVYPAADQVEYANRFRGPYMASFPFTRADSPKLVAIPGNHDWYDGLTSFMRLFCSSKPKWIGGRRTCQTRSYFAVKLPNNWWLWGIDIQFDSYIDDPQLDYFRAMAESMDADSRLILCTGKPSWTDVQGDPAAFQNLAYFQRTIIDPTDAKVVLFLSGDSHHYARFDSADGTHRITAGGGGAFLHPTHHLDDPLDIPVEPDGDDKQRYDLRCRYPPLGRSRIQSAAALALPFRNKSFMLVPAVIYLLLGWATQFAARVLDSRLAGPLDESAARFGWSDLLKGLFRNPVSLVVLLAVLGGLIGFAKASANWSHGWMKIVAKVFLGGVHFVAQVVVGVVIVGPLALKIASWADGFLFNVVLLAALMSLGGLLTGLTMGTYLAVCCAWLRTHGNEAYSAVALTTYKNFLRLHLDGKGVLTVYPVGLRRSTKKWQYDPDNPDEEAPWLRPAPGSEPQALLIEKPVVIDTRWMS